MYGWRGRLAVIVPYDNCVLEPEFSRLLPPGVSAHVLRLRSTDRETMAQEGVAVAPSVRHLHPRAALYACLATSFMHGLAVHDALLSSLRQEAGVPTETAASAMVAALQEVSITRVAVATPYPEWLNDRLAQFLEEQGFRVHALRGLGLEPEAINDLWPQEGYALVRALPVDGADGVFICATNFRSLEILQMLEIDLGVPVVSANQALAWAGLRAMGVGEPIANYGSLLRRNRGPASRSRRCV